MTAIYKKELRSYFINPIGYVYLGIFLAISALVCCYTTLQSNSYSTSTYFYYMIFAFVILIPILTMRSFAEERKMRTEQMLLTAPVTITGMVMGKYLAAMTMFCGTLIASCINFFPLYVYKSIETSATETYIPVGPSASKIIGCLIGVTLIGAAFVAIGLFISSLTENQLAAAVVTVAVIVVMLILNLVNQYIDVYVIRAVIDWICVLSRFTNFSYGILDFPAVVYYLSLSGVFLLLTNRVYEKRRWG